MLHPSFKSATRFEKNIIALVNPACGSDTKGGIYKQPVWTIAKG